MHDMRDSFKEDLRGSSQESLISPCFSPSCLSPIKSPSELSPSPNLPEIDPVFEDNLPDKYWESQEECLQLRVDEHIEEVTTHHYADISTDESSDLEKEPESNHTKKVHKTHLASEEELPSLIFPLSLPSMCPDAPSHPQRIVFPEFGADLIEASSNEGEVIVKGVSDVIMDSRNWEDNWLFRKQKHNSSSTRHSESSMSFQTGISMLIPSPTDYTSPMVGERDIDDLSEFSDHCSSVSSCDSIEELYENVNFGTTSLAVRTTSHDISSQQEVVDDFSQKYLEHTEHMTLPHSRPVNIPSQYPITNSTNKKSNKIYINGNQTSKPRRSDQNKSSAVQKFSSENRQEDSTSLVMDQVDAKNSPNDIPLPKNLPNTFKTSMKSCSSLWFISSLENQTVCDRRTLRLSCQVMAKKLYSFRWYKDDTLLIQDDTNQQWRRDNTLHLNVFEITPCHSGRYSVVCYTSADCIWESCYVKHVDKNKEARRPNITRGMANISAEEGCDTMFVCQVSGHPEPRVSFRINDMDIHLSSRYFVENDAYGTWTLHISSVRSIDEGIVEVIACNTIGQSRCTGSLTVCEAGQSRFPCKTICNPVSSTDESSHPNTPKKKKKNYLSKKGPRAARHNVLDGNRAQQIATEVKVEREIQHAENSVHLHSSPHNHSHTNRDLHNTGLAQPPAPGTIAEREHRKWMEAKPIVNNPYSPERLVQRLEKYPSMDHTYTHASLPADINNTTSKLGTTCSSNVDFTGNLSRYSRDYFVDRPKSFRTEIEPEMDHNPTTEKAISERKENCSMNYENEPITGIHQNHQAKVSIKSLQSSNWKEELRNIRLDVGEKVDELQKTIDAIQKDWEVRLSQRGWNVRGANRNHYSTNHRSAFRRAYSTDQEASIYSSSEVLNLGNRDKQPNKLWKTTSVGDLTYGSQDRRPVFSYKHKLKGHKTKSLVPHKYSSYNDYNTQCSQSEQSDFEMATCALSESLTDVASSSFIHKRNLMGCSYDSLVEEIYPSDNSSTVLDVLPQLPSVKELASKFDSGPRKSSNRRYGIKSNMISLPSNAAQISRKTNGALPMQEIHHSLTARSVARYFKNTPQVPTPEHSKPATGYDSYATDTELGSDPPRDTSSPEHLGIPSSRILIKPRHTHARNTAGDTSDDSIAVCLMPRKTTRRRYIGEIK